MQAYSSKDQINMTFSSFDLDLDSMTLILEHEPDMAKMYVFKFLTQGDKQRYTFVEALTDRHTDRHTYRQIDRQR